jgi:uncharacterized protein (DUF4415 family)
MKAAIKPRETALAARVEEALPTADAAANRRARKLKMQTAVWPTADEDAAITAAALTDVDNPPLDEANVGQFKPARRSRGRPVQDATKVPTTMRLDSDVLDSFKATGEGWQTRVNAALRAYLIEHELLAHRYHATVHRHDKEIEQLAEFLVVAPSEAVARSKVKDHLSAQGLADATLGPIRTVDVGNARVDGLEVIY